MLNELKLLIFGYAPYEKTKIEERFLSAKGILPKLEIKTLQEFELLDECIHKIKEMLRVKSSNLNKTIKDPSKRFTKKFVLELIEGLTEKKLVYINSKSDLGVISESDLSKEEISEAKVYETSEFKMVFQNAKTPYLKLWFNSEIDYVFLKTLLGILYEDFGVQSANVICEGNLVLLVPRVSGDKLFVLPKIESDLKDVFGKIVSVKRESGAGNLEVPREKEDTQNYVEIIEPKETQVKSNKKKDNSLDALLFEKQERVPPTHISSSEEKSSEKIRVEKNSSEDKVVVEREVSGVRNLKGSKNDEKIEIIRAENVKDEKLDSEGSKVEEKLNVVSDVVEKKVSKNVVGLVYEDEQLLAYLNSTPLKNSEIIIESKSGQKFKDLSENELSYITLFSKVFSATLFDTIQAHGTNILWNYNDTKLRIVPRFQNDELPLKFEGRKETESFLEKIRERLLSEMQKELSKGKGVSGEVSVSKSEVKASTNSQTSSFSSPVQAEVQKSSEKVEAVPVKSDEKISVNPEKKEKIIQLLAELERIP